MSTMKTQVKPKTLDLAPRFWELSRNVALDRFALSASKPTARIEELADWDRLTYGSKMSLITAAGKDFKFVFKVHFFPKKFTKVASDFNSMKLVLDFFREYCNLVAGAIKEVLMAKGLICGISLPIVTSGDDEMIFSDKIKTERVYDYFRIHVDGFDLVVSSTTDGTSESVLQAMRECAVKPIESDDFEF